MIDDVIRRICFAPRLYSQIVGFYAVRGETANIYQYFAQWAK
jgi:hypothetical protein